MRKIKKIQPGLKLVLFIVMLSIEATAQDTFQTDSLWSVWQDKNAHDTLRAEALDKFVWKKFLFTNQDSAFKYAQIEYDFAEKRNLDKYKAYALSTQATGFYVQGNFSKAIEYHNKSLVIKEKSGDRRGVAATLTNLGIIYSKQGNIAKAVDHYHRSLFIFEELDDQQRVAGILNNIGLTYEIQGDNSKALEYYFRSLRIKERLDDQKGAAYTFSNIGVIYQNLKDYDSAIHYMSRSLQIHDQTGNLQGRAIVLNNLGTTYKQLGEYEKSLDYFNQSLSIKEQTGDLHGISTSLINVGEVEELKGNKVKAISYYKKANDLARELGVVLEIKNSANGLYRNLKEAGNYREALEMFELYSEMKDSLLSEENQKELIRQEYKYQYDKQAAADSIRNVEEKKVTDAQLEAKEAQLESEQTQKYALYGGVGLLILFGSVMYNRFRVTNEQKGIIEIQKRRVDNAYSQLEEKNKEILSSINYAKRIQNAILPPPNLLKNYLNDSFILYKPKDIVAGDFYWTESVEEKIFFTAADCTGHGVPGAMISVVCSNILTKSVKELGIHQPSLILDKSVELLEERFAKSEEEMKDGMDLALCCIDLKKGELQYAGANNPLYLIRDGKLTEIKADKQPVGRYAYRTPYTNHTIEIKKGDCFYLFSDGYMDQFGGEKGKKFKASGFKELLLCICNEPMEYQKELLEKEFDKWRGTMEQVDDLCILGVKI